MRDITYEPEIVAFAERCLSVIHYDTFENVLEQERQKAEQERQKAEQERQKAKQERQKAKQERQKTVLNLHRNLGLNATNIASLLELDVSIVAKIIDAKTES